MMEDCAIKYYNEGKAKILYSFPEYVFKEMLIRSKYQRAIWYHPQRPENKETLIYPGEHYT